MLRFGPRVRKERRPETVAGTPAVYATVFKMAGKGLELFKEMQRRDRGNIIFDKEMYDLQ